MMLRSFIAVDIPAKNQEAIQFSIAQLKKTLSIPLVRWVASQNVHLTLKFIGAVSPANLKRCAEAMEREVCGYESFSISIGGLGAFPTPHRARIIWIGLENNPSLRTLLDAIDKVTARLGYPTEQHPFSPHLTIGRIRKNVSREDLAQIGITIEKTMVESLGAFQVDAVQIYKSDLLPDGPVYTRLYSLPLKSL
jgi:2'-5' RNA ligase